MEADDCCWPTDYCRRLAAALHRALIRGQFEPLPPATRRLAEEILRMEPFDLRLALATFAVGATVVRDPDAEGELISVGFRELVRAALREWVPEAC